MASLGKLGGAMALSFGALGSCLGVGAAGPAAVGSWKKCYLQNKAAPFVLVTFVGAPLSQTIYGMILMNQMSAKCNPLGQSPEAFAAAVANWPAMLGMGLFGGMAMGLSAWIQGKIGASAS
ncbi:MAG: V-type ATP synthase subunit K, partial [Planctomycetota bacterium]|nr:V-type ATP synthase subunit K [Planctomycetota bacterium]